MSQLRRSLDNISSYHEYPSKYTIEFIQEKNNPEIPRFSIQRRTKNKSGKDKSILLGAWYGSRLQRGERTWTFTLVTIVYTGIPILNLASGPIILLLGTYPKDSHLIP